MAKTKQDFTEEYLKKKKISSYDEYVADTQSQAEATLRESISRADTALAQSKASYGARAASLLSRGLNGSGYGDYLEGAAYAARVKSVSEAQKAYERKQNESKASYAAYLEKLDAEAEEAYEKEQETLSSAFSKLLSANIVDEGSAAAFLMGLGVDEESAKALAKKNAEVQKGVGTRRNSVLSYALSHNMYYSRAYAYALANGLSADVAKEIAKISQEARDSFYEDGGF